MNREALADIDLPADDSQDDEGYVSPALSEAVIQTEQLKGLTKSPLWVKLVAYIEDEALQRAEAILGTVITESNRDLLNGIRGERLGLLAVKKWFEDNYGAAEQVKQLFAASSALREDERNGRTSH